MANAFRRRLQQADDATLSQMTESFCQIGTPLPPLDPAKKDPNEYKPIWQREARDEQGRRRFHGAFTGGWSAGYFNTVGSKEGWTPSSFKSSRKDKDRGEKKQSRPEDFMDEEDLAHLKESKELRTAGEFSDTRDPLSGGTAQGSLAEAALEDLIKPTTTSLGVKLLKRMGWKEGHGLGPRISADKRDRLLGLQGTKPLGDSLPEAAKTLLFPPPDIKLMHMEPRTDRRGLGHSGGSSLNTFLRQVRSQPDPGRPPQPSSSRLPGIRATAHGDSDDEADVYAGDGDIDMTRFSSKPRVAFEGGEEKLTLSSVAPPADENTWHDGRPMLAGFSIASRKLASEPWFAPPPVPKGWQPNPQAIWAKAAPKDKEEPRAFDAEARGSLLGEVKMPGPPPALADFLSAKARERLESSADLPQLAAPPSEMATIEIPKTDPRTAHAALHGFMPFGNDYAKQDRYRAYLTSQAEGNELDATPARGQTVDQLNHELREFAKSAAIFRPMSTAMASRFTSSAAMQDVAAPAPGLWQPPPKAATKPAAPSPKAREVEELFTPAQQAARDGMFGIMTRTSEEWHPVRLLCKRFNVPDPYPDRANDAEPAPTQRNDVEDPDPFYGASKAAPKVKVDQHWERNKRQLQHLADSRAWESAAPGEASVQVKSAPRDNIEELGLGEDERQGRDTLTYVKPPADIFRAIFASDEESEDEQPEKAKGGSIGDPTTSFRPAFVPRAKRRGEDAPPAAAGTDKTEKRRKKAKSKPKGMLTFDLDEGGEESFQLPSKDKVKSSRPKASDLFD